MFFASNPRQVFSRDQLMDRVWGYQSALDTGTVTVHIRRLRKKIEDDASQVRATSRRCSAPATGSRRDRVRADRSLSTLAAGIALALALRLLPTVRLQLVGLALLAVGLPLAAVILGGLVMFHMHDDVKILAVAAPPRRPRSSRRCCSGPDRAGIRGLEAAAEELSSGELKARAPTDAPSELAHVGEAFNTMASNIEALFDARRQLVAWASHDLRTPVASIQAMLEAIEDGLASFGVLVLPVRRGGGPGDVRAGALVHLRTRPGRAWAAIRQSEPAALAAGINTTFYKLWAFALASFITGVAGAVLAGQAHYLYSINFTTQDSIVLLAVALMGGAFNMWGAVVAALLMQLLPAILQNLGVSYDWLTIVFGIGVLQVLTTAPAGLADQFPKDMKKLGGLIMRGGAAARRVVDGFPGRCRVIEVSEPDRQVRRRHLA